MRVAGEDHVDARYAPGKLAVDVEAVMRQQHNELGAGLANLLDIGADIILTDAKRPVRDQPTRIGDRLVREGLAEHGDLDAALLEHFVRREHRLIPVSYTHLRAHETDSYLVCRLLDPRFAIGEFPMAGHGVGLEQRHAICLLY